MGSRGKNWRELDTWYMCSNLPQSLPGPLHYLCNLQGLCKLGVQPHGVGAQRCIMFSGSWWPFLYKMSTRANWLSRDFGKCIISKTVTQRDWVLFIFHPPPQTKSQDTGGQSAAAAAGVASGKSDDKVSTQAEVGCAWARCLSVSREKRTQGSPVLPGLYHWLSLTV